MIRRKITAVPSKADMKRAAAAATRLVPRRECDCSWCESRKVDVNWVVALCRSFPAR